MFWPLLLLPFFLSGLCAEKDTLGRDICGPWSFCGHGFHCCTLEHCCPYTTICCITRDNGVKCCPKKRGAMSTPIRTIFTSVGQLRSTETLQGQAQIKKSANMLY
uniref:Cysteine rich secreted protein n=1 Tax=Riptortus pedestris TaxID=329032 RepID=R4WQB7_RIPPE|nr:cysteine rich secreted protein [Riptortus pedestris]